MLVLFFCSSIRRHTRCTLVTGVQTCALPIEGVTADFMPGELPEWGQCVHKVAVDAESPSTMYLQNHGGVFRSIDAGVSWQSIDGGLPPSNLDRKSVV